MNDEDRYVMYLVIPTSLKMNMGKTAAAVGHAVMLLERRYRALKEYLSDMGSMHNDTSRVYDDWYQMDFPSYAKIVLGASYGEFDEIQVQAAVPFVLVIDRGFSQVQPNTKTCIGLWPMKKSEAPDIIKKLKPLR
jgi:peptidyl-tRNA hydrolase